MNTVLKYISAAPALILPDVLYAQAIGLSACLQQQYRSSIVKIESNYVDTDGNKYGPVYGTGFIVHADGQVITAKHVIDAPRECVDDCKLQSRTLYVGEEETEQKATVEEENDKQDFALLRLKTVSGGWPFLPIAYDEDSQLEVGEIVVALGIPQGFDATVTPVSIVTSMNAQIDNQPKSFRQTSLSLSEGMSGGPVFDGAGRAVGLSILTNEDVPNVGYVSELTRVRALLSFTGSTARGPCAPPSTEETITSVQKQIQEMGEELTGLKASFDKHAALVRRYISFDVDLNEAPGEALPTDMVLRVQKLVPDGPKVTSASITADPYGYDPRINRHDRIDRYFLPNQIPENNRFNLDSVLDSQQDLLAEVKGAKLYWLELRIVPTITHEDGTTETLDESKIRINYLQQMDSK
ncbi:serine protease [Sinorhizobium meliloti]|uniref:S1 family peptidase n=1 Tax=Rhizobium meliloti TaxID=382 RepID=UPI000FD9F558|nr:serine protease [Sinorhizobium meliloti]RVK67257.1 serine protease [Sinorhizobium meliloti]